MYTIVSLGDLVYNSIITFWVYYIYHSISFDNYYKLSIHAFLKTPFDARTAVILVPTWRQVEDAWLVLPPDHVLGPAEQAAEVHLRPWSVEQVAVTSGTLDLGLLQWLAIGQQNQYLP